MEASIERAGERWGPLDLDVRRPLSKRGTLGALQGASHHPVVGARCHSNAAAREKEGPQPPSLPCPCRWSGPAVLYDWA
jgi:hypothetical protein